MEFTCSCNTAEKFENICKQLAKGGYAKLIRESVHKDGKVDTSGFSTAKYDFGYREVDYDVNVKDNRRMSDIESINKQFNPIIVVPIRFWYDRRYPKPIDVKNGESENIRNDRAGIKITDEGLGLIAKSMTVVGLLQKAGYKVSDHGAIDLDTVIEKLNVMIEKV